MDHGVFHQRLHDQLGDRVGEQRFVGLNAELKARAEARPVDVDVEAAVLQLVLDPDDAVARAYAVRKSRRCPPQVRQRVVVRRAAAVRFSSELNRKCGLIFD
jgi:hypothetical protein